jgi:hypothetical protein
MTTDLDFPIKLRRAALNMRHASIRFIGFAVSVPVRPAAAGTILFVGSPG